MSTNNSPARNQIGKIFQCLNAPSPETGWWSVLDMWDRCLLILATSCLAIGVFFAWLSKCFVEHQGIIRIISFGLLVLGEIASILYALKQAYAPTRNVFRPTAALMEIRSPAISRDVQVLPCLLKYAPEDLEYAGIRLNLEAKQARKRIGLFSPGIEKVGIVPAITAGIVAGSQLVETVNQRTGLHLSAYVIQCVCVAIVLINITAVPLLLATYRLDQLAQLLKFAATKKREKAIDDRPDEDGKAENAGRSKRRQETSSRKRMVDL
jgi:hypothetical protein